MFRFLTSFRIAIGITCLGASVLLLSQWLGLGQDEWTVALRGRAEFSEAIGISAAAYVPRRTGLAELKETMRVLVHRNEKLLSAAVRRDDQVILEVGDHLRHWMPTQEAGAGDQIKVPIRVNDDTWGHVELRFVPLRASGFWGLMGSRIFQQVVFVILFGTVLSAFYLKKMLHHLDPASVIPDRVRAALDTFAEGLLVVDKNGRIVLANRSFAEIVGETTDELQGRKSTRLPWTKRTEDHALPWLETLETGTIITGRMVDLNLTAYRSITFMVNASPIMSDHGKLLGVLASFDDVTLHEQRKKELETTLEVLGESRERIRQQNEELIILATRDPLTGCLNRRSFFEKIEDQWEIGRRTGRGISCVMVDVDHFKSINDCYGHSVGDEVLRCMGLALREITGSEALACRYGGEEFCMTIFDANQEETLEFAHRLRQKIECLNPNGIRITASLGASRVDSFEHSFQELLEEADRSLYVAKNSGRNRVVTWEEIKDDENSLPEHSRTHDGDRRTQGTESEIAFHAVTALISALSFRDVRTAEHSRRVADLCVLVASSEMSIREQYVLETAALLHDIGKIGVPDSVLHKPGPLDDDEYNVMQQHVPMGVEILETVFVSKELVSITENRYTWFDGSQNSDGPSGEDIPLGSRILAIADAYDSMISGRVYRPAYSEEEAYAELRRGAAKQFDPRMVDEFISKVTAAKIVSNESVNVPKQTALRIGLLMERLTVAVDSANMVAVQEHAKRLTLAANEAQLEEIEAAAAKLQVLVGAESEDQDLIMITSSLLDLCRMTQKAYVEIEEAPRRLREKYATQPTQSDEAVFESDA